MRSHLVLGRLASLGLALGTLAGCPNKPIEVPVADPIKSTVTVSRARDVVADGKDSSTIVVRVLDKDLNPLADKAVTLSVEGEGAVLTQPAAATDANGEATGSIVATAEGVKTITATVEGVTLATKPTVEFARKPATAVKLAFKAEPANVVVGRRMPAVTVAFLDASDAVVPVAGSITLKLGANPGSGQLGGTLTGAAVAGVATFSDLTINKLGKGYTLKANSTALALPEATSQAFDVTAGPVASLGLTGLPATQTAGVGMGFTITALDDQGLTVDTYAGTVNCTSSDADAAIPGAYTFKAADAGTHAFEDLVLTTAGAQTLTCTDGTFSATGSVSVTAAAAAKLGLSGLPNPLAAGTTATLTVQALDAYDNLAKDYVGTVRFKVENAPDAAAVLPADYTFLAADQGAHDVTLSLRTAGTHDVVATDTVTATITGKVAGVVVPPGAATALVLSGLPSTVTAGVATTVTVRAVDAFGNAAPTFTSAVTLSTGVAGDTLPAAATLTNGAGTFNLTFRQASARTVTASGGGLTATANTTVQAASPTRLRISGLAATAVAGVSAPFTVSAVDAFDNVAPTYAGTVTFASSDATAEKPAASTLTAGTKAFAVTFHASGSHTLTASDGALSDTASVTVQPGAATRIALSGLGTTATSGVAKSFQVTAYDSSNNVATGYSGTVSFTTTDGTATKPAAATLTAGVGTFSVTFRAVGAQTLTATDGTLSNTANLTVGPGPAATLHLTGLVTSAVAGTTASFTVTAKDAAGNVATGYTGPVDVTSSDPAAVKTPASASLSAGVGTFSITLKTAGTRSVTVTDRVNVTLTVSQNVTVNPADAASLTITGLAANPVAGLAQSFTLTARDAYGNVATGYAGTIHFTSTDTQAVLPADGGLTSGTKDLSATFKTSGARTLTASDGTLTTSTNVTVAPATVNKLELVGLPASAAEGATLAFSVRALDSLNNVATGYAGTVSFTSNDPAVVKPGATTLASGQATGLSVKFNTSGARTLSVSDGTLTGTANVSVTDTVAPNAVADLAATGQPGAANLSWTATGDNAAAGTATTLTIYRVAAATCPADAANFVSPTVTTKAATVAAGQTETASISPLAALTHYCFAVKVADEVGNTSGFSNVAEVTTGTTDYTPPAATSDLHGGILLAGATSADVSLTWTAAGDDANVGTATSYTIKYATGAGCPIDAASFAAAPSVTQALTPQAPGNIETLRVSIPVDVRSTAVCFALKTVDDSNNASGISNVVTPPAPVMDLAKSGSTETSVSLSWHAVGRQFMTGTADRYQISWAPRSGASCPADQVALEGAAGYASKTVAGPAAPTTAEANTVTGLLPGRNYCVTVAVQLLSAGVVQNFSVSPVLATSSSDLTGPTAISDLQFISRTSSVANVRFTAVADNGPLAKASKYVLTYRVNCAGAPVAEAAPIVDMPATPDAGTPIDYAFLPILSANTYCVAVQAYDAAGNWTLSNELTIPKDATPPGALALEAPAAGDVTSTAAALHWTAVAEDGTTAASGKATAYDVRFVKMAPADTNCGSLTAASWATATPFATQPTPVAAVGARETANVALPWADQPACVAAKAIDAAGNASTDPSNWVFVKDNTPPAAVADFSAGIILAEAAGAKLGLAWTAPGNDGTSGTVTSYVIKYATDTACPITSGTFAGASTVVATFAPQAAGQVEKVLGTISADVRATKVCFALEAVDAAGNVAGLSNVVIPPAPVMDLATTTIGETSIGLTWHAVGRQFLSGLSDQYMISWAPAASPAACPTDLIGLEAMANYASKTVNGPAAAGTVETNSITGLSVAQTYCITLGVMNSVAGNDESFSISPVLAATTVDTTGPTAINDLALLSRTSTAASLRFKSVADNGPLGKASKYVLAYQAGCSGAFVEEASPIPNPGDPAPGTDIDYTFQPLLPASTYCVVVRAYDPADNFTASNQVTIPTDATAPGTLTIQDPAAGDVNSTTATLRWTAVAEDGTTAASGKVTAYDVRYVTMALSATDCSTLDAASWATATAFSPQPSPVAAVGAVETAVLGLAAANQPACVAAKAIDAAGNPSAAPSNWVFAKDSVVPSDITNLHVGIVLAKAASTDVAFTWTAPGNDGTAGTAAQYVIKYATGTDCPLTGATFDSAATVPGAFPAQGYNTTEVFGATLPVGVESAPVCFAVKASDAAGNASAMSNVVTPPRPILNLAVTSALETSLSFTWDAVGRQYLTGTLDRYQINYAPVAAAAACPSSHAGMTSLPGYAEKVITPVAAPGSPEAGSLTSLLVAQTYCVTVSAHAASAGSEDFSVSPVLVAATVDTSAPTAITDLSLVSRTSSIANIRFTSVADNNQLAKATRYVLAYQVDCTGAWTDETAAIKDISDAPAPGATIDYAFLPILPTNTYCLKVKAYDPTNNVSESNVLNVPKDAVPPGTLTLDAPAALAVSRLDAFLRWTAVAEDGTNAATGKVTSYDFRRVKMLATATDCASLTAADYGPATKVDPQPTPTANPGDKEGFTFALPLADQPSCFAATAIDANANVSVAPSNWIFVRDNTPPAINALNSGSITMSTAQLTFIATGDDGTQGQATAYDLRMLSGTGCAVTESNFDSSPQVTTSAPQAAGATETFSFDHLTPSTTYCFGLKVVDAVGNKSTLATTSFDTSAPPSLPAGAADLMVSELNFKAAAGQTWLELQNLTGTLLWLGGVKVTTNAGTVTLPPWSVIGPFDVYVVGAAAPAPDPIAGFVLAATDHVYVKLPNDTVIDDFDYSPGSFGTINQVASLSSIRLAKIARRGPMNWCDTAGSPGAKNTADCSLREPSGSLWCRTQYPQSIPFDGSSYVPAVVGNEISVFSRFYLLDATNWVQGHNDFFPFVEADFGYGPTNDTSGWTWVPGSFNVPYNITGAPGDPELNNDEMEAKVTFNAAGTYKFGWRYRWRTSTGPLGSYSYCNAAGDTNPTTFSDATVKTTSEQIADVRSTGSGPIVNAIVTYVRPTTDSDPKGFFVQAEQAGPALFVNIDPTTLDPVPVVGDKVSIGVPTTGTLANGVLAAITSLDHWERISQGNDVSGFVQAASNVDLVAGLASYESEVVNVTGTIMSAWTDLDGFSSARLDTAANFGTGNTLEVRAPTSLVTNYEAVQGCQVTVQAPLWRLGAVPRVQIWQAADGLSMTCPAPKVTSATGPSSTSVVVDFDRKIDAATLLANGSQFTLLNGATPIAITSAALTDVRQVTLQTANQPPGASLSLTADVQPGSALRDLIGTRIDSAANTATFTSFKPADCNVAGFKLTQNDSGIFLTFASGTVIPGGGLLVVGRNATKAQFETFWGVTLASNVVYVNNGGNNSLPPVVNGDESYTLTDATASVVDGATVAMQAGGGQDLSRLSTGSTANVEGSWSRGACGATGCTPATPGSATTTRNNVGHAVISEFSDSLGTGNFAYEFVEILCD